jgi:hypothetical protein
MKKVIQYYLVQGDHIFAVPEPHHSELIENDDPVKLRKYIESQKDSYGCFYKKKKFTGFGLDFDYTSNQGAVKVKDYVEDKKKVFKKI